MLTIVHSQKFLQSRHECQNWTVEQWKKVACSDESCFLSDQVDACVHNLPGEEMAAGCTMASASVPWMCVPLTSSVVMRSSDHFTDSDL